MPLSLETPATVVPAVMATAFEVQGFAVNVFQEIMDVTYSYGTMSSDTPPVFVPQGNTINLHLEGDAFTAFVAANPTLYPAIKAALYAAIEADQGVSGTVI